MGSVERFLAALMCAACAIPSSQSALRDASRLSGFRVRHAVPITKVSPARYRALFSEGGDQRTYARLGLFSSTQLPRAWYDVRTQRLFVQRGPRPGRRALIHEYVRALIDQNVGLRRLVTLRAGDHDRRAAAQGMVDGVASLSSGLSAPGRPLAAQLRYLGGRRALTAALRTFPQTTEQLLHVDKFLQRERALPVRLPARIGETALGKSETFGELDVRSLLQSFHVPGAVRTGEGWGGGRLALYGDVAVIVLRWDSAADAAEWQQAVPRYVAAAFPGAVARTCPPLDACWGDVAAGVYGTTSVLASGPGSAAVAAALLQQG
jgi:hypothetical protein